MKYMSLLTAMNSRMDKFERIRDAGATLPQYMQCMLSPLNLPPAGTPPRMGQPGAQELPYQMDVSKEV